MSRGKYVFPQVMEYYPSWVFDKAVKIYNADYHVRVSSSAMCRFLLFGQLSVSLRLTTTCLFDFH